MKQSIVNKIWPDVTKDVHRNSSVTDISNLARFYVNKYKIKLNNIPNSAVVNFVEILLINYKLGLLEEHENYSYNR